MKVDLTREGLISLVKGTEPNYGIMDSAIVKKCGTFSGSYGKWSWNYSFDDSITDQQLWDTYILYRDSFKL